MHPLNFSFYFKIGACRYGDRCSRLAVSTPNPASAPPFCSPTSTNVNIQQHFQTYNAKLSNLGLATLGLSSEEPSVSTVIAGTIGYIAPECITAGDLFLKSDVYGFGVVLLELLMGLRVNDAEHPCGEQNLVDWLKPILSQEMKLKTIMDAQMDGQYSFEAALQAAQLNLRCLELDAQSRPSMKEVM